MPLIKLKVLINKKKNVTSIYDSGATATLISSDVIRELKAKILKEKHTIRTIGGRNFVQGRAKLLLKIGGIERELDVYVIRNSHFCYDLLLGLDAIQKFQLIQDENLNILQKCKGEDQFPTVRKIEFNAETELENSKQEKELVQPKVDAQICLNEFMRIEEFKEQIGYLSDERKKKMITLMKNFEDVFATSKFDVGTVKNCVAEIKLLENRYVAKKPYRCSIPDQKEIESQISELLKKGLIEESWAAFASPVTLAYKREEGRRSRLCIDFRELNNS